MGHPNTNAPSHLTWQICTPSTPSEMGRFSRWYCLSGSMRGTCCPRSDLWETTDNIITTDGRRGKEGEEERKESEEGKSYMGRRWGRTGTSVRAACERAEMQKAGGRRAGGASSSLEFGRASSGGRACSFQAVAAADIHAGVSLGRVNLPSVPKDGPGPKCWSVWHTPPFQCLPQPTLAPASVVNTL